MPGAGDRKGIMEKELGKNKNEMKMGRELFNFNMLSIWIFLQIYRKQ